MNIKKELFDIGNLLREANMQQMIRKEVKNVLHKDNYKVINGKYASQHAIDTGNYDFVVVHTANDKEVELITRRLASLPNVEVKKLDGLTDGVIGIRQTRRK